MSREQHSQATAIRRRLNRWAGLLTAVLACGLASPGFAQSEFDVFEASITDIQAALESGVIDSAGLVQQYLARIQRYDRSGPRLNSIIRINGNALAQARLLDEERARSGPRSLLHGIPILVKDNYSTTMMPTTNASVALANFTPNANAAQIDRLLEAGAIILAKTNLHEYARGITTISSLGGQTRNPYDLRRVPGGSSGGTGAAVAASFGSFGLGSDTCGSIRIPSSFNNLIGLRPTKGLGSIYGVMPLSHTQDVAGPLARSAEDLAIVLDIVNGADPRDAATMLLEAGSRPEFLASLNDVEIADLRLGKLLPYMESASGAVRERLDAALEWYEQQGATIVEVEFAELEELLEDSGVIAFEFKPDLNDYLAEFGSDEIASLADVLVSGLVHESLAGAMSRSEESELDEQAYEQALAKRLVLRDAITELMGSQQLDALVYPTVDQPPVLIGEPQRGSHCALSANSGLPALSMPVGFSDEGLPIGMELLGAELADAKLLAMAAAYERAESPRKSPWLTPSLGAQQELPGVLQAQYASLGLQLELNVDRDRNVVNFEARSERSDLLTAVTLHAAQADGELGDEPVLATILQPQQSFASGEIHLSPTIREAYVEQRLWLRVFSRVNAPAEGLKIQLREVTPAANR